MKVGARPQTEQGCRRKESDPDFPTTLTSIRVKRNTSTIFPTPVSSLVGLHSGFVLCLTVSNNNSMRNWEWNSYNFLFNTILVHKNHNYELNFNKTCEHCVNSSNTLLISSHDRTFKHLLNLKFQVFWGLIYKPVLLPVPIEKKYHMASCTWLANFVSSCKIWHSPQNFIFQPLCNINQTIKRNHQQWSKLNSYQLFLLFW